jgi:hypothetical protein
MIQNINANTIQDILPKPTQRNGQGACPSTSAEGDATLQIQYAPLVAEAIRASESDVEAVQRAKELLASGQLDTVENIRQAAQDLLDYGA